MKLLHATFPLHATELLQANDRSTMNYNFSYKSQIVKLFASNRPLEGVVAPWCNPLTLQPEQSGGVGSSPGRAPSLERHDKGSRTRLGLLYFCDPSAWR